MGITDKVSQMADQVQEGAKNSLAKGFTWLLIIGTSFLVSLTITLIAQQMMQFGNFSFVFMMIVSFSLFIKLMKAWSISKIIVFDLICLLTALCLRMYILVAP